MYLRPCRQCIEIFTFGIIIKKRFLTFGLRTSGGKSQVLER